MLTDALLMSSANDPYLANKCFTSKRPKPKPTVERPGSSMYSGLLYLLFGVACTARVPTSPITRISARDAQLF